MAARKMEGGWRHRPLSRHMAQPARWLAQHHQHWLRQSSSLPARRTHLNWRPGCCEGEVAAAGFSKGALPTDGGEGEAGAEDGLLDAAQRRVAEALQKRLQRELEGLSEDDQGEQQQAAAPPPQQQQAAADDGSGEEQVRLFRRVKAGAPVLDRQQLPEAQQQGAAGDGSSQAASSREARCLEKPTKARCKAAAVEADAILGAAAVALQQSAQHVSPRPNWVPADDDPSRLSHRRKRRLAKLAAEAQAGKLRLRVLRRQAARVAAAAQEATAQQAAAV